MAPGSGWPFFVRIVMADTGAAMAIGSGESHRWAAPRPLAEATAATISPAQNPADLSRHICCHRSTSGQALTGR